MWLAPRQALAPSVVDGLHSLHGSRVLRVADDVDHVCDVEGKADGLDGSGPAGEAGPTAARARVTAV